MLYIGLRLIKLKRVSANTSSIELFEKLVASVVIIRFFVIDAFDCHLPAEFIKWH